MFCVSGESSLPKLQTKQAHLPLSLSIHLLQIQRAFRIHVLNRLTMKIHEDNLEKRFQHLTGRTLGDFSLWRTAVCKTQRQFLNFIFLLTEWTKSISLWIRQELGPYRKRPVNHRRQKGSFTEKRKSDLIFTHKNSMCGAFGKYPNWNIFRGKGHFSWKSGALLFRGSWLDPLVL